MPTSSKPSRATNYANALRRQRDRSHPRAPKYLEREIPALLARRYPGARRRASRETRLSLAMFPVACPWSADTMLDEDFWPEDDA